MNDKLKVLPQYLIPQHGLSRLAGWGADLESEGLKNFAIRKFIKAYGVNMQEAERENPEDYRTFNDFFTRALKPGVRPVCTGDTVAHPADGVVSQCGPIENGRLFQAKGHTFSVRELLGGDGAVASEFAGGDFATIYLSPKDYHRVHMPIAGKLRQMFHVPGRLFSVNPLTARSVPNLFARNERAAAIFDTELGPMAMILVGATIVGSIETVWAGTVTPPTRDKVASFDYRDQDIRLAKGEEMGRFKLGSTVVLLFPKDRISFAEDVRAYASTTMGECLATCGETD